ncbi:MAG: hypothetical protein AB1347_08880 [Acidobacteriota bacterium]
MRTLRTLAAFAFATVALPFLAQGLQGTWLLVKDSDETRPKTGATVTLALLPGGAFALSAVQPGETLEDAGTYEVSGSRITLAFTELDLGCAAAPFTLSGDTLVLPFKVFGEGAGTSTWQRSRGGQEQARGGSGGTASGGSGTGGRGHGGAGAGPSALGSPGSSAPSGSGSATGSGRESSASPGSGSASGSASSGGTGSGSAPGRGSAGSNRGQGAGQSGAQAPFDACVGMWTGHGSSYEVRFREKGKMTVAVLHDTVFAFVVQPDGEIVGHGTVVYDVDPNLCGVAALAQQVNQAIDMMNYVMEFWNYGELAGKAYKAFAESVAKQAGSTAAMGAGQILKEAAKAGFKVKYDDVAKWWKSPLEKIGEEIRDQMRQGKAKDPDKGCQDQGKSVGGFEPGFLPGITNVPGVTKVQYEYKGLAKGPEVRSFAIRGRAELTGSGIRLRLQQDGGVQGGDTQLWVQYTVNYVTEKKPFPCWSPFLDGPATVYVDRHTGAAKASFRETGDHRNGVKPWQEYIYVWEAEKMTDGAP